MKLVLKSYKRNHEEDIILTTWQHCITVIELNVKYKLTKLTFLWDVKYIRLKLAYGVFV